MARLVLPFAILLLLGTAVLLCHAQEDAQQPPSPATPVAETPAAPSEAQSRGLSEAEWDKVQKSQESFEFKAEVNRLMDIIINSLYSNREIFMRELISNAADALDKIRFISLTNKEALGEGENADLDIKISFDRQAKTITLRDRGIGMTKEELIKNLGIVAKSGTTEFVEKAMAGGQDALSLIGQFGVGFYSVYLVADRVTVVSKNNDDVQHIWESTADKTFTVAADPRGNTLGRGTSVTLHLKADAEEFLHESTLEKIVTRYSQFVNFPIYMEQTKEVEKEVPLEGEELASAEAADAAKAEKDDVSVSPEEDAEDASPSETEKTPKTKKVKETVKEWKRVNDVRAIWTRNPKDIEEEEYEGFYKSLTKDDKGTLAKIHFTAEGEITFRSILYIPKVAEAGLYDRYYEKSTHLKLYVRRVLISDEFDDFLPRYLNFIKGVVDSEDLPLNVSRETLAQSRVLKVMSKKLTRKVLEMLKKLSEESEEPEQEQQEDQEKTDSADKSDKKESKYDTFWKQFGKSIKLGLIDDRANKNKLTKLLRFPTSKSDGKFISLDKYVENMKEKQKTIYYITGESMEAIQKSPFLERVTKLGFEVLFMADPLDEYVVQSLSEYEGNQLQSVTKEGLKLGKDNTAKYQEDFKDFAVWLKEVYGDKVEKVVVSSRLASSPAIIVTGQYGWSANMERIMKAQTFGDPDRSTYMASRKTLEINPRHPLIRELKAKSTAAPEDQAVRDLASLMYDAALVQSGFSMSNAQDFASRIHRVMGVGLGVDSSEEIPEELEPEDDETNDEDGGDGSEDSQDLDDVIRQVQHEEL